AIQRDSEGAFADPKCPERRAVRDPKAAHRSAVLVRDPDTAVACGEAHRPDAYRERTENGAVARLQLGDGIALTIGSPHVRAVERQPARSAAAGDRGDDHSS